VAPGRILFTAVHRFPRDRVQDPTVLVERERSAGTGEILTVRNVGPVVRLLQVQVVAATDLADMATVKNGGYRPPVPASPVPEGNGLRWAGADGARSTLTVLPATLSPPGPAAGDAEITYGPEGGTLTWAVRLAPASVWSVELCVSGHAPADRGYPVAPRLPEPWSAPEVFGARGLADTVRNGLADLAALRLADPLAPDDREDQFIAAGCPWYLTLFGRDSIWAARMTLPLGTRLAAGTLWALARRQGRSHDVFREEAPGRILHELRPASARHGGGMVLPASYYGSMDATPLFVNLLVDAWRWGLPDHDVAGLLPHAQAAMRWIREEADRDGDGLLEYASAREDGLAHQGWKDSPEAVRDALGRRVQPPIALCEVQGYAYEAAVGLAALLDHRGRRGAAEELYAWAYAIRKRFRDAFWVTAPRGSGAPAERYVAVALGRDKIPVQGPASNMGHLLGTGILDEAECRDVAAWLAAPELNSGWGLRSRSSAVAGFNPLSYHGGSVWTHDTAIAVQGLAAAGFGAAALDLAYGLLDAAAHFQHRLPELYGGEQRTPDASPLVFPAACRPQGWAAASGMALVSALLGLRADARRHTLRVRPIAEAPWASWGVRGLRVAGHSFDVRVDDGKVTVTGLPEDWRVVTDPLREAG
jgi:hypothetical protein